MRMLLRKWPSWKSSAKMLNEMTPIAGLMVYRLKQLKSPVQQQQAQFDQFYSDCLGICRVMLSYGWHELMILQ